MGMSIGGGGGRKAMSDINVTPLVDVMLVLLIIFMVSTPLIVKDLDEQERLLDMNLPVTDPSADPVDISQADKLILRIDANLRVFVGDELLVDCQAALNQPDQAAFLNEATPCFDTIQRLLGNNPRLQNDESLYLLADTTIPYGFVVGVMNRIRMAGVTNVGMVTNPELMPREPAAP